MAGIEAGQRFPFINLEKAVERAKKLYDADQRGNEMAVQTAFTVWEYSEKSSGGFQTVAALKSYGLLVDLEGTDTRKVKLSGDALRYFRDEREDERAKLLQTFATRPPMLLALWNLWGAVPPADAVARSYLKIERGLNEQSSRALLNLYKDNLAFANLKGDAKITEPESNTGSGDEPPPTIKVGDYVQWTSQGVDQFKPPRKVTGINGRHAFVHGSNTGINMSELTAVPPPAPSPVGAQKSTVAESPNDKGDGNEISVLQAANRLQITADVDDEGLEKLLQMLGKYKEILKMLQ